jgi:hypothetical protein
MIPLYVLVIIDGFVSFLFGLLWSLSYWKKSGLQQKTHFEYLKFWHKKKSEGTNDTKEKTVPKLPHYEGKIFLSSRI